jgi:hypothetical protein
MEKLIVAQIVKKFLSFIGTWTCSQEHATGEGEGKGKSKVVPVL